MHGVSSTSHWVATGLVVSGVEATSIRSILSLTISSRATSAARLGLDWLSLTMTSTEAVPLPIFSPPRMVARKFEMTKLSASANAASGPVCGLT